MHSFNEFEIKILSGQSILFDRKKISSFSRKDIEFLFIQFIIVNDFIIENKIVFIDLNKFTIIKSENYYTVKFHIQLLENNADGGLKKIVDLFKRNEHFSDLDQENVQKKFRRLMSSRIKAENFYIYKYKDFSSNFLNLYNLENIKTSSNTIIRILTENKIVNRIIKSSLYSNLYSNNFFFFNIDDKTKNVLDFIVKTNPDVFKKNKYELLDIINKFEEYILQSSIRSVIFFIDKKLTTEEENFFKYLLNMTKLKNIVLISFGIDIGCTFDLELNDSPKNYFPYIVSSNSNNKIDPFGTEISEKKLVNDLQYEELLSNIKSGSIDGFTNVELVKNLLDILIGSEQLELAERILRKIKNNSLLILLKTAQIYRVRRDYKGLKIILRGLPDNIPDEYDSEYNYLNYYFKDRFGDPAEADGFFKKIREVYFINLANIHKSDRLIKKGDLKEAYRILYKSKEYFKKFGHKIEELEADEQIAKYYRESGDKKKAEYLYKTAFFYAEMKKYLLLSASISLDIGNLFLSMDDFNQAEFWYKKSLNRYEKAKNKNGIDICEFNLSDIYKINGEWIKSQVLLEKALIRDRKSKRVESVAIDCFNIAHLEYLKKNVTESIKYIELANENFEKKGIINGLIDTILLSFRIKFSGLSKIDISDFEKKYLMRCNKDQEAVFLFLKDIFNNVEVNSIIKRLNKITSLLIKFEMNVFFMGRLKSERGFNLLKKVTSLLSRHKRNYFFYEYHYIYFNYFCNIDKITEKDKNLFLEVYYFFLKNGRIISQNMTKLKKRFVQNNILKDILDNARVVDGYKGWKTPSDFFYSFSLEIQKIMKLDYVYMNIYLEKKVLFHFSNKGDYLSISKEMVDMSIRGLSFLSFSTEDIKKMRSREKLFYPYETTKVIPWKISETLFGILILGFNDPFCKNIDMYTENKDFFVRYASLFSDFYSKQFLNSEKLDFIIGTSKSIETIKNNIIKLSSSNFSILISGESGTGKELIAKALHNLSHRNNKPFVPVNIAAIPESLMEAELFGTRKGAFTGANEDRVGLIESADNGTLFLDEIGEIPINLQAKLLRTLDSGEVRRLGENKIRIVDIHILSATNRNLKEMVKKGEFREDLFYRIAELEIESPPLRERFSDIPLLAEYFLKKYKFPIEDEIEKQNIMNYLIKFKYKGNIRELESKIKEIITYYPDYDNREEEAEELSLDDSGLLELRDHYEKSVIIKALQKNKNRKQLTAEDLKISRMHLSKLIKKHKI